MVLAQLCARQPRVEQRAAAPHVRDRQQAPREHRNDRARARPAVARLEQRRRAGGARQRRLLPQALLHGEEGRDDREAHARRVVHHRRRAALRAAWRGRERHAARELLGQQVGRGARSGGAAVAAERGPQAPVARGRRGGGGARRAARRLPGDQGIAVEGQRLRLRWACV
jgi:hypothetical protein